MHLENEKWFTIYEGHEVYLWVRLISPGEQSAFRVMVNGDKTQHRSK